VASSPVIERLPNGARVAVVRLRSLGDCVLTTPALDILKRHRPDLRLAVVVEQRFADVFRRNPDVETILPPDAFALRSWRPDLCLNFHGGTRSALLTASSGAKWRCGFAHFRFPWLYNVRIPRAQEILGVDRVVHTAEHLASAVFFLGAPQSDIPRAKVFSSAGPASRGSIVVIHPFASQPGKTWPAERFREVIRRLDMPATVLGGPRDDLSPFGEFPKMIGRPLEEVKSLLSVGAALFIGNDSGPAHMAAAFGVPLAVIFGTSDVEVWRPWKAPSEVLTSPSGIDSISVDQVLAAVSRLRVHA
jgi:lipopolysaccharide heptosyltransferase III